MKLRTKYLIGYVWVRIVLFVTRRRGSNNLVVLLNNGRLDMMISLLI